MKSLRRGYFEVEMIVDFIDVLVQGALWSAHFLRNLRNFKVFWQKDGAAYFISVTGVHRSSPPKADAPPETQC